MKNGGEVGLDPARLGATVSAPFDPRPASLLADLAIIVPTYNEAPNVPLVVDALARCLVGIRWEVVFVDDNSPDGTADCVKALAREDPRVRLVHRLDRHGLSSACIEGILASAAPYVAVMDGDMQHDVTRMCDMYRRIRRGDVDIVVGSRYSEGGGIGDWDKGRAAISQCATWLAIRIARTTISDPLSGFFMISRIAFLKAVPNLSSCGFKILLDILASSPTPLRAAEVAYRFRARQHGESKLDSLVMWEYLELLLDKTIGALVPARLVRRALVDLIGLFAPFLVLTLVFRTLFALATPVPGGRAFAIAQGVATGLAMASAFFLDNVLSNRGRRLKGISLVWGWMGFNLKSAIGLCANIGLAHWLYRRHIAYTLCALAGIAMTWTWTCFRRALSKRPNRQRPPGSHRTQGPIGGASGGEPPERPLEFTPMQAP